MGGSLSDNNVVIVGAFHNALRAQLVIVLILGALALLAWVALHGVNSRGARPSGRQLAFEEHPARRLVRIGFGLIWLVDGLLQAQQSMPVGLPTQVVGPAASTSPSWVQHLVNDGLAIWTRHPVPAAAASVWIQVGIGALLILAPRGRLSQGAGLLSVAWGLGVWVFGEAFGGIFAPGLTWMFGAPGAVLLYCVGGVLVALPERAWLGRRLGRLLLAGLGVFLVGMAVLQAWPGRGFWQGAIGRGGDGAVSSMVSSMSQTPQPASLSSALRSFASFDAAHGWGVNLFVVLALAGIGLGLLSGRRRVVAVAVAGFAVLSLADWVLVQDLGFLGGVGTDPNSMVPTLLVVVTGYVAVRREAPATVTAAEDAAAEAPAVRSAPAWLGRLLRPAVLGVTTTVCALGVFLVGAVPMAMASVNPHTDAILSEGLNGVPDQVVSQAGSFHLFDQHGAPVTLASLRGRTVALTFLDPVCTSDCPLIAQEFRTVDEELGATSRTAFVAVVANPIYRAPEFVQAFDRQERLTGVRNWYYLTGSLPQLEAAWQAYGIEVQTVAAGGMVAHDDDAFVIDGRGRLRAEFGSDPGGASSTAASLATVLLQEMRAAMRP